MKQLKNPKAFSLIELVIVITILAIMAIVSIPSYLRYIERASLAEAIAVLGQNKTGLSLFWSTQSRLPTTGDTVQSTPVDLPFGSLITANLPDSIQSMQLLASGNGLVIQLVIQSNVFSSYPSNNRQLALGAKPVGDQLVFECGNLSTNATIATDIGFTDISILPGGCNYNGVAAWLTV